MSETSTLTLSDFLLARIAEDEAEFDAAVVAEVESLHRDGCGDATVEEIRNYWLNEVPHATRWPRVLAECHAKRLIVELRYSWNLQAERMTEPPFGPILQAQVNTADAILRTLARVYVDHPDYRDEWRP